MYLISYGCSVSIAGPTAFRIAWAIQAVPGLVLGSSLFFFPESPRWLASKDRWDECIDTLAHLHGGGDRESPVVLAEIDEVREAAAVAAASKDLGYLGLFAPGMWFRTLTGVSAQVWQQLLGGNVMLYYIVYIFEMAGEGGNAGLTSAIIQYVIFLVTTGGVLPFVDRVGRRPLLSKCRPFPCLVLVYTILTLYPVRYSLRRNMLLCVALHCWRAHGILRPSCRIYRRQLDTEIRDLESRRGEGNHCDVLHLRSSLRNDLGKFPLLFPVGCCAES